MYTESGTYTFESTNEFGCTHVSTLNLTINNSSSSSEDVTVVEVAMAGMVLHTPRVVHIF